MDMIKSTSKAFFRFVRKPTWGEGREVVEEYQDVLLVDSLNVFIGMIIQAASDDSEASRVFAIHQEVLQRCRDDGIDVGFDATLLPDPKPQGPLFTPLRFAPSVLARSKLSLKMELLKSAFLRSQPDKSYFVKSQSLKSGMSSGLAFRHLFQTSFP